MTGDGGADTQAGAACDDADLTGAAAAGRLPFDAPPEAQSGTEAPSGTAPGPAARGWVVVPFPQGRAEDRAAGTTEPTIEAEAAALFRHLNILSDYCYGQGHMRLYNMVEELALELAATLRARMR